MFDFFIEMTGRNVKNRVNKLITKGLAKIKTFLSC